MTKIKITIESIEIECFLIAPNMYLKKNEEIQILEKINNGFQNGIITPEKSMPHYDGDIYWRLPKAEAKDVAILVPNDSETIPNSSDKLVKFIRENVKTEHYSLIDFEQMFNNNLIKEDALISFGFSEFKKEDNG